MSAGLIALHAVLAVLGFLITLNFYLRGRAKAQVAAVLSVLLLLTIGAVWLVHGWVAGVVAIPMAYVYVALTTPLARTAAWRMLGYRTSAESGSGFADLHALEAGNLSMEQYFEKADRGRKREQTELQRIVSQPAVQATIRSLSSSEDEVAELVRLLSLTAAGRELALKSIAAPGVLADLLTMRREGKEAIHLAARVMRL
jgi:hypothetical protein